MLSTDEWILIGVIVSTLALIASGRVRADLVAILVLVALPITGLVTFEDALAGFSRSVVITLIGLFMITQALEDAGIVAWIAGRLRQAGGGSEVRLVLLFMAAGSTLSLVMNNVAAGAVLLPAAVQVGRESKVSPSKLLIPLSFGTLVGGMATYFTTANIIMSGILRDQGLGRLDMMDFIPTGGLIVLAGLLFMALVGRHMLPEHEAEGQTRGPAALSKNLYDQYKLGERLWDACVRPGSALAGVTLSDSRIGAELGVTVLAIGRGRQNILSPAPTEIVYAGDCLAILGRDERVQQLHERGVAVRRRDDLPGGENAVLDLTEIIIPPRSSAVGKTLAELHFRKTYDLTAIALWRGGRSFRTDVGKMLLDVGDALLLTGAPTRIRALAEDRDFMMLESGHAQRPRLPEKAGWALAITAVALALAIFEILPTPESMMLGAAALAVSGCINLDEAYRAIEWRVIFLIAGLLPISTALINTGLAARVGSNIVDLVEPLGPLGLIGGFFLLTMGITQIIGGQVSGLIVGPIAVTAAVQLHVDPRAMATSVAIACSAAFLTPVAHPVNMLMMGPGGYSFGDFTKIGLGFSLITFVTLLGAMVLFWGV